MSLHMTIPQIRARMFELADEYQFEELRHLAEQTKRRSPVRRSRSVHAKLTPAQEQMVRDHAVLNPTHSYKRMGQDLDVDIGRISEVLAGKRGDA